MTAPAADLDPTERRTLSTAAVQKSRQALQRGERLLARRYAEQAAALAPETEDPWLILAALASPKASLAYLQRALEINPASQRAQKGLQWAQQRLTGVAPVPTARPKAPTPVFPPPTAAVQDLQATAPVVLPVEPIRKRTLTPLATARRPARQPIPTLYYYAVATIFLALTLFAISLTPYYPQITSAISADQLLEVPLVSKAAVYVEMLTGGKVLSFKLPMNLPATPSSPTLAPTQAALAPSETPPPTPTAFPVASETPLPTPIPTETPTLEPSPTALPTETPLPTPTATLEPTLPPPATIAPPTPQPAPTRKPKKKAAAANPGLRPSSVTLNDRWIDVDLSSQTTYAMQGDQVMQSFRVSTGRWPTVTVEGVFKVYVKYRQANMSGDDYFLPNVPYVMYFFKGYGLHGTYWHNNFGTPMSHGCVNLRPEDAGWLYDFASVGTIVSVHQ